MAEIFVNKSGVFPKKLTFNQREEDNYNLEVIEEEELNKIEDEIINLDLEGQGDKEESEEEEQFTCYNFRPLLEILTSEESSFDHTYGKLCLVLFNCFR